MGRRTPLYIGQGGEAAVRGSSSEDSSSGINRVDDSSSSSGGSGLSMWV